MADGSGSFSSSAMGSDDDAEDAHMHLLPPQGSDARQQLLSAPPSEPSSAREKPVKLARDLL